jgi:hypothetical protein
LTLLGDRERSKAFQPLWRELAKYRSVPNVWETIGQSLGWRQPPRRAEEAEAVDPLLEAYCEILAIGLVNIRSFAVIRDSGRCQIETEHVGRIPLLLCHWDDPKWHEAYWSNDRLRLSPNARSERPACFTNFGIN